MSYPPPSQSPYQSRLFNFLNRQYININTKLGKYLRKLKLGMKWTLQIMLYPLYLMVQTTRIIGRNLQSTFKGNKEQLDSLQNQPTPSLLDPDQQINIILKEIAQENIVSSLSTIDIQGIATNIENSHLVLVNSHNQTIDVLSLQQQEKLQLLMRDLRADYWEKKRSLVVKEKKLSKVFPLVNPHLENNFVFFGLFWQLIAWGQKSSLAISLNVFGESEYLVSTELQSSSYLDEKENKGKLNLPIPKKFLTNIDNQLANLENTYLFNNQGLVVEDASNNKNLNIKPEKLHSLNENKKQSFSIQALIKSAIDYFFGNSQNKKKLTNHKNKNLSPSDNHQQEDLSKKLKSKPQTTLLLSQNHQKLVNKLLNNIKNNLKQFSPKLRKLTNTLAIKIKNVSKFKQHNITNKLSTNGSFKQQKDPFQIQVLIRAAIDYFFNKKGNSLSSSKSKKLKHNLNDSNFNSLESSEKLIVEENWLSWDDLYGQNFEKKLSNHLNEQDKLAENLSNKNPDNISPSPSLPSNHDSKLTSTVKAKISVNSWHHKKNTNQNKQKALNKTLSANQKLSTNGNSAVNSNQKQLESHQKLLDTKAVNLGYEKHFLQTILEWIDKAILWIEELFLKIFHWLKRK